MTTTKKKNAQKRDIFQLLLDTSKQKEKRKRKDLLDSMEVKEFFEEGAITVDMRTCQGVECELCIKACPTNALYWKNGKIAIVEDLCVYCGACVTNCIVDDCIVVTRKRADGRVERFSKPIEVVQLFRCINSKKRHRRLEDLFPDPQTYVKRYRK